MRKQNKTRNVVHYDMLMNGLKPSRVRPRKGKGSYNKKHERQKRWA